MGTADLKIKKPSFDVKTPDLGINLDGKLPSMEFEGPKAPSLAIDVSKPKLNIDVDGKLPSTDVTIPAADFKIKKPSFDIKTPDLGINLDGKLPELKIGGPK